MTDNMGVKSSSLATINMGNGVGGTQEEVFPFTKMDRNSTASLFVLALSELDKGFYNSKDVRFGKGANSSWISIKSEFWAAPDAEANIQLWLDKTYPNEVPFFFIWQEKGDGGKFAFGGANINGLSTQSMADLCGRIGAYNPANGMHRPAKDSLIEREIKQLTS